MNKGKIIVIDGMDGTGKNTQAKLLFENFKKYTDKVCLFSFPNYDSDSSYFVKKLLNGEFNDIKNPFISSLFYSLDRGISYIRELKDKYEDGYIIIMDRYTISNTLYEIQNFETKEDKLLYIDFMGIVENEALKLPVPDLTIIFYADPEVSDKLLNKRYNNDDNKRDQNENIEFQRLIYDNIKFIDHNKNKNIIHKNLGPIFTYKINNEIGEVYSIESIQKSILSYISL